MAATEIQPFVLAKKRTDERFHCCPGPVERQKILLAKRVEMQARNALQIRSAKLADRMAQTAMRLAGIIFLDFPFAVFRIDAKTDVERLSHSPCRIDLRSETFDLRRTIEDHMVLCLYNRWKVLSLISGAIGCNLAAIFFAATARPKNSRTQE